jgi:hypothetical protein
MVIAGILCNPRRNGRGERGTSDDEDQNAMSTQRPYLAS